MRITHALSLSAGLAFGAVLSYGGAQIGARVIETVSQTTVEAQLLRTGYDWVDVQSDGLQIILSGTAPDEASQLAAQRQAGHVVDQARVINVIATGDRQAITAPEFSIEILQNESGISLFGLAPTDWDKDGFVRSLKRQSETGEVADLIEQADYPIPDGWNAITRYGLSAIDRLPRSKISLSETAIEITGITDSKTERDSVTARLNSTAPDDIELVLDISAPRPVISPFTVRFLIDENGPRFDACAAETETGHARILAKAAALDIEDATCVIGLGAPSSRWANAVEVSMEALSELGSGTITLSDTDVSLIASEGADPEKFDTISAELQSNLPSGFSLFASLPESADAQDNSDETQFTVIRTPEGQVQLRGRLPDERSQAVSLAVAKAHFGVDEVLDSTRIDANLPIGWTGRVLATMDAASHLTNGTATMTPETVRVTGQTSVESARADIAGVLSNKLGEGEGYDINVSYVPPVVLKNIPTPEECVAAANDILAVAKIKFEPGSVFVDPSSFDTLDQLADALIECEDATIEIGGHTDSQGREEMNQNLSQSRANSVLDAMLARRVAGVKFTAVGYGETQPIGDNETEEGREANRRIEFKLADETAPEPEASE